MSGAPLLAVEELAVHFSVRTGGIVMPRHARLPAVDGVSFELAAGETLGIVGESGCGKSTLGRAVLRLIEPTAGRLLWRGADLRALSDAEMRAQRRHMQIVFQDPLASLDPRMTVGDIVAEPLRTHEAGMPAADVRARVEQTLERVGLQAQMLNRYPHEFSGGQRQRIGIARAMILEPAMIVCDEPVSALDVSIQAQIINLLTDLQHEFGLALLFISHDLSVVRHISHRIMVLYLGRVMEIADRDTLFRGPRHPYTQALIAAVPLPDPDKERAKRRMPLRGELPSPLQPPSGCVFRTRCPFAVDACAQSTPALESAGENHRVACHRWREVAPSGAGGEGQERVPA